MSISAKKPWWRRWLGSRSERAAARYLRQQGLRILTRNYSCRQGEIDLIAAEVSNKSRTIVFVEVRSTEEGSLEDRAESVDLAKQTRITNTALDFLRRRRLLDCSARFDVLILSWSNVPEVGQPSNSGPAQQEHASLFRQRTSRPRRGEPAIRHYPHAFEAVGHFQLYS